MDAHLSKERTFISPVISYGFCSLNSIIKALKEEHGVNVVVKEAVTLITEEIVDHSEKYIDVLVKEDHEDPLVTDANLLVTEAIDFSNSRNFYQNIVDVLVKVTADALGVNLFIYRRNGDKVQVHKCSGGLACKPVYIKFPHNNLHPQGNHYKAILQDKSSASLKRSNLNNLELSSDVSGSKPKVKKAKDQKPEDQKQPLQKVTLQEEVLQPLDLSKTSTSVDKCMDMSMNLSVHDDQPLDLPMKSRRKVTKENNDDIEIVSYDPPDSADVELICVEPPMVAKGNVNDDIVMIDLEADTETPKKTKEIQVVSEGNQPENSNEHIEMEINVDIHQVYDDVLYVPEGVPEKVAEKKEEALPKVGRGGLSQNIYIQNYHTNGLIKYQLI